MRRTIKQRHGDKMLAWLRQVAEDPQLTPFSVRVAVILANLVRRDWGYAEISQQGLADEFGATKTGVRNALSALIERRHLHRLQLGSNGAPSHYAPRLWTSTTTVAQSALDRATAVALTTARRSATQEAALRDAEMRSKRRTR